MATHNKDFPPFDLLYRLTTSKKMSAAFSKINEIRDYYFEGCEILVQHETGAGDNYVMFNIMGKDGKPVQSYLWDEEKSFDDKPAFHDWSEIMEQREAEKKPKKVKKGKKNRSKK